MNPAIKINRPCPSDRKSLHHLKGLPQLLLNCRDVCRDEFVREDGCHYSPPPAVLVNVGKLTSQIEVRLGEASAMPVDCFEYIWIREGEFVGTDPDDLPIALVNALNGVGLAELACRCRAPEGRCTRKKWARVLGERVKPEPICVLT